MEEAGAYVSQAVGGYERGELNGGIEQKDTHSQYTIHSVLHFIQSEWTRIDLQRSQWEMERAELQARIAFLQGERRGQENVKQDLVRRIKMLEHALKQERIRYHQLKSSMGSNTEKLDVENSKPGPDSSVECNKEYRGVMDPGRQLARSTEQALQSNAKWRESRVKLRHFLQEVGYTDSVLAIRQSRVRQLLGATNGDLVDPESSNSLKKCPSARNSQAFSETEESVLRTFDFLDKTVKSDEKSNPVAAADAEAPWNDDKPTKSGISSLLSGFDPRTGQSRRIMRKPGVDNNLVEFLNSLSDKDIKESEGLSRLGDSAWLLGSQAPVVGGELNNDPDTSHLMSFNSTNQGETEMVPAVVGLGDLASLTVANEAENGTDADQCETGFLTNDSGFGQKQCSTGSVASGSRPPWTKKFSLKGHFDAVRSIAFHPNEPYLFSGGEDGLVMLWALRRPGSPKPNASNTKNGNQLTAMFLANMPPDLDPIHIYRGHVGPVLSVSVPAVGQCASVVYSSSLDGVIRGWRLPSPDSLTGLFDLYSLSQTINERGPLLKRPDSKDAVWSISVHPSLPFLASVDTGTAVAFWSLQSDVSTGDDQITLPLDPIVPSRTIFLSELIKPSEHELAVGRPTSVTFFSSRPDPSNATQCLVGTSTGWLALIDVETGKVVNTVSPPTESPSGTVTTESGFNENNSYDHQPSKSGSNSVTYPAAGWGPRGIHAIATYQTFSLAITGHEDRCIRFYDITRYGGSTGVGETNNCCVGTIATHLDAVTCLTVDPHDLYVLTGSHDSSIRLWDLQSRACVQELTCHRVKNNESIHAVAMHPTIPFAASAGADALCKVYASL